MQDEKKRCTRAAEGLKEDIDLDCGHELPCPVHESDAYWAKLKTVVAPEKEKKG